jgi:aspartyl-tRNA(Asn)/glutamyl-tRNA(Gln) amidotransferase subunit A
VERAFPRARRRPRIGVLRGATKGCMPAVARNFRASLQALATFCDVETGLALPAFAYDAAVWTIVRAEGAAAFRALIESGRARDLRSPDDRIGGYVGYATPAVDYIDAQRLRTRMVAALDDVFGEYDAIVSPTLPTVTYPVGAKFDETYPDNAGNPNLIAPGNLTGRPALALPNGFGEHGLPTSVALLGNVYAETALTAIGARLQRMTGAHRARPPLVTAPATPARRAGSVRRR